MSEEQKRNHVRALNLLRRHLPKEARAAVLADMRRDGMTLQQIAEVTGISKSTVHRQLEETVFPFGKTEPQEIIGKDGKSYPATKPRVGTPGIMAGGAKDQAKVESSLRLIDIETGEIVGASEIIRSAAKVTQSEQRQHRVNDIELSAAQLGCYPLIYADPPWRYEHVLTENRAIENHYPTMSLDDICALPVSELAHKDAVLFLWATSPKLAEAMRVVEAWGFTYRTCMVWVKDKIGMGRYARQQHELLLIAARGALPVPEPGDRVPSVVYADRTQHSAKPTEFYEIIEAMYPEYANRIELFSRAPREGWAGWGNQYDGA
jgi:N6-adenosine-specific RNA methylase IME4/DNA-binding CsgD family transcriptional regulator